MLPIVVSVVVDAPLGRVWGALADLPSHTEWMADAEAIHFLTDRRSGVGTVMTVETRIGPFRLSDRLEVTAWEEGRGIAVDHQGIVRGAGRFDLSPMANGIRFTWREQLHFPWWLGGPVTALVARPVLARVWAGNLSRFKRMLEVSAR